MAVIPSRFQSSRFPGKALVSIDDTPLVAHVARRVLQSGIARRVLVATDDQRIAAVAAGAGAEVCFSDEPHVCGTDRVAAAVQGLAGDDDLVLNVQGDEALVDGEMLRAALEALEGHDMGTVACRWSGEQRLEDADVVKVLLEPGGNRARQFTRDHDGQSDLVHAGIYAFQGRGLRRFAELPRSAGERAQRLEQLRAMEAGMSVGVSVLHRPTASVNRPQDVEHVQRLLRRSHIHYRAEWHSPPTADGQELMATTKERKRG